MVALILGLGLAWGGEVDPRALADRLQAEGMARQAYAELLREALAAEEPETRARWEREAGALLWRAGAWQDAAAHFVVWSVQEPDARLGLAYSLYGQGAWTPAGTVLLGLEGPQARYLQGWTALQDHAPALALEQWRQVPAGDPLGPPSAALVAELSTWGRIPYRSPGAAGLMSAVLPGSGQAYAGRWGEAGSALLVNGLLIASAVELGRRELWFGMGLALFFEAGFYGGNVLSATHGARRFNRRTWEDRVEPLEARFSPSLQPGQAGWELQAGGAAP